MLVTWGLRSNNVLFLIIVSLQLSPQQYAICGAIVVHVI